MGALFHHANQDVRTLLTTLGIDEYNTQALITTMFSAPAATDLQMQAVILVVQALQRVLRKMGAVDVYPTGELDVQTAAAIAQITGPDWKSAPWYMTIQAVIYAADHGRRVRPRGGVTRGYEATSGFELPAMPGGAIGWLALAGVAYHFLRKH